MKKKTIVITVIIVAEIRAGGAIGFSKAPGHARAIPYQSRGVSPLRYWTEEEEATIKVWLTRFTNNRFNGGVT